MNGVIRLFVTLLLCSNVYAADVPVDALLDKVAFQVSAKQWVTTQTALLTVTINATLSNSDLVKVRTDIMSNLAKIAQGEWHIIQFDRSQDSSGLEKLNVVAQVRMDQHNLTNVYLTAKSVSKPGANYQIGSIEFKPSLAETQLVRVQLRERLYQLVNDELIRINKVYNTQKFSLNSLVFLEDGAEIQTKVPQAREMMMVAGASNAALTLSNELMITAVVEVASNRISGEGK